MDETDVSRTRLGRRTRVLHFCLVALAGYLLGSFLPAGYVSYLVRSKLAPETLPYQEPPFDRAKLDGARYVPTQVLLGALETNPQLFRQTYENKPVIVSGTV